MLSLSLRGHEANLPYTICFVVYNDEVLTIHRLKRPNINKKNGLGGKIELTDKTIRAAVTREVWEETDETINLTDSFLVFAGIVTWKSFKNGNPNLGGMYAYAAKIETKPFDEKETKEGMLSWQKTEKLLDSKNINEVAENIHVFLPYLLAVLSGKDKPKEYCCDYTDGHFCGLQVYDLDLPEEVKMSL